MLDSSQSEALLQADEPAGTEVILGGPTSPYVITCDHAGRRLPRALGTLGLTPAQLETHIAWDIGAAGVVRHLAALLDAFAVLQTYSRLVIDCNRPLHVPSSIARQSEHVVIPGNHGVSAVQAERRVNAIFRPYHACIEAELARREHERQPTIFIAMHSFTPTFLNIGRPWHAGVLYNRDARLAAVMLAALRSEPGLIVGDNEPYSVSDESDYGVLEYGERRGLLHVELEVRQDLIADAAGQREWAERLARLLREATLSTRSE